MLKFTLLEVVLLFVLIHQEQESLNLTPINHPSQLVTPALLSPSTLYPPLGPNLQRPLLSALFSILL